MPSCDPERQTDAETLAELYEERMAIAMIDGEQTEDEAGPQAFADAVRMMADAKAEAEAARLALVSGKGSGR